MEHNLNDLFKMEKTILNIVNNGGCYFDFDNCVLRFYENKNNSLIMDSFRTSNEGLNKTFEAVAKELNDAMRPIWLRALNSIRQQIDNNFQAYKECIKNGG